MSCSMQERISFLPTASSGRLWRCSSCRMKRSHQRESWACEKLLMWESLLRTIREVKRTRQQLIIGETGAETLHATSLRLAARPIANCHLLVAAKPLYSTLSFCPELLFRESFLSRFPLLTGNSALRQPA